MDASQPDDGEAEGDPRPVSVEAAPIHSQEGEAMGMLNDMTLPATSGISAGSAPVGEGSDSEKNQQKPPFSYAQLIVQALLAAKDHRQTLSSIYSFISDMYPYYKMEDKGWKVSE